MNATELLTRGLRAAAGAWVESRGLFGEAPSPVLPIRIVLAGPVSVVRAGAGPVSVVRAGAGPVSVVRAGAGPVSVEGA